VIPVQQRIGDIIHAQAGLFGWNWTWLFPLLLVYFISGVAETNRAPFDVAEGESEIVAGFHVDYSGMAFALFFIAEYVNMILISALTVIFFFGGWLSPFDFGVIHDAGPAISWLAAPSILWLLAKIGFFMFAFLWVRATFPRFRYDQIMRLGWKIFIPVALPGIIAAMIFAFTVSWAAFVYPMAFLYSADQQVLTVGTVTSLIRGDVYGAIVDRQHVQAERIVGLAHIADADLTAGAADFLSCRCCHAMPRSVQRINMLPARRMSALNR